MPLPGEISLVLHRNLSQRSSSLAPIHCQVPNATEFSVRYAMYDADMHADAPQALCMRTLRRNSGGRPRERLQAWK
eukprot:1151829-Rhodomonas_salina.1